MTYPIADIRADFPMLARQMNDKPLVYLDNAATTHKPKSVIDRLSRFYSEEYGTVRRGVYALSRNATSAFEEVRRKSAAYLGAQENEIIFVRGVTEAVNLVASALSRRSPGTERDLQFSENDEIVISEMEHHSNIVPWQLACEATGASLRVVPMTDAGELRLDLLQEILDGGRVRLVSVVHVSNALGTVNPVAEICRMAARAGALSFVDGAQSAAHMLVDVRALGCDFFACSGHKMVGPTGVGLLFGRHELLARMQPWMGGGEMIDKVTFELTTYDDPPHRFEAGTPAFADVIAFGTALDYLQNVGLANIEAWDRTLVERATANLRNIPGLRIYGTAAHKSGVVSFGIDGVHSNDIGTLLDHDGICIRVGQHCVQPVMEHFGIHSTARASFCLYSTPEEIDFFSESLERVVRQLRKSGTKPPVDEDAASSQRDGISGFGVSGDFDVAGADLDELSTNEYLSVADAFVPSPDTTQFPEPRATTLPLSGGPDAAATPVVHLSSYDLKVTHSPPTVDADSGARLDSAFPDAPEIAAEPAAAAGPAAATAEPGPKSAADQPAVSQPKVDPTETENETLVLTEEERFLVRELSKFSDWKERYNFIMEFGARMPAYPAVRRTDQYRIKGCQSQVWILPRLEGDRVLFDGDSDAAIVKGLLAMLLHVYSGRTPGEILTIPGNFIKVIGLADNLSATRAGGLASMLKQIRLYGVAYNALLQSGTK